MVAGREEGHFSDRDHRRAPGLGGRLRGALLARAVDVLRGAHLVRGVLADGGRARLRHGRWRQRALAAVPAQGRRGHGPYRRPRGYPLSGRVLARWETHSLHGDQAQRDGFRRFRAGHVGRRAGDRVGGLRLPHRGGLGARREGPHRLPPPLQREQRPLQAGPPKPARPRSLPRTRATRASPAQA